MNYMQCDSPEDNGEAVDSRGIPGWDEVDHVAQALISLDGICVTNTQAQNIQSLYTVNLWTLTSILSNLLPGPTGGSNGGGTNVTSGQ